MLDKDKLRTYVIELVILAGVAKVIRFSEFGNLVLTSAATLWIVLLCLSKNS